MQAEENTIKSKKLRARKKDLDEIISSFMTEKKNRKAGDDLKVGSNNFENDTY